MANGYPWQQGLWQQLARRPQHAHAYLLHGPSGTGKRDFASALADFLLCQKPQGDQPCGVCRGCLLLAAGTHPDRFELKPAEDRASVGVDQVRELVHFVGQTAQLAGRKLVLIAQPPVEEMTLQAANALLKSLEEPAGATVMLLLSDQPSRVLPTVRSRCVQQAMPLPTAQQAADYLQAVLPELAAEQRGELLQLAAGSPLRAQQLAAQGVLEQRALVVEGVKKLLKQQAQPTQLAEGWKDVPLLLLFDWFSQWAQLLLRYQLTGDADALGAADMHKVLQYLADKSSTPAVLHIQDWLLEQRQKLLGKAPLNRVLLLEALLLQWARLPGSG